MLYVWLEDAKKKLTQIIGPGYEGTVKDFDNEDKQRRLEIYFKKHLPWDFSGSISPDLKSLLASPEIKFQAQQEYTGLHQEVLDESKQATEREEYPEDKILTPRETREKNERDIERLSGDGEKIPYIAKYVGMSTSYVRRIRDKKGITKHRSKSLNNS